MNALVKNVNARNSDLTAATVTEVRNRKVEAERIAVEAARRHEALAIALELGDADTKPAAVDAARQAKDRAGETAERLKLALTEAERRHTVALEADEAARLQDLWDQSRALADEIDVHLVAFVDAVKVLNAVCGQIVTKAQRLHYISPRTNLRPDVTALLGENMIARLKGGIRLGSPSLYPSIGNSEIDSARIQDEGIVVRERKWLTLWGRKDAA